VLGNRALCDLNETLERRVAEALAERKIFADLVEGTDTFVQVLWKPSSGAPGFC
jgi:hypothetical protein